MLISNMKKAMEFHQVLTRSERNPAELMTGRFDGIKVIHTLLKSFVSYVIKSYTNSFGTQQSAEVYSSVWFNAATLCISWPKQLTPGSLTPFCAAKGLV